MPDRIQSWKVYEKKEKLAPGKSKNDHLKVENWLYRPVGRQRMDAKTAIMENGIPLGKTWANTRQKQIQLTFCHHFSPLSSFDSEITRILSPRRAFWTSTRSFSPFQSSFYLFLKRMKSLPLPSSFLYDDQFTSSSCSSSQKRILWLHAKAMVFVSLGLHTFLASSLPAKWKKPFFLKLSNILSGMKPWRMSSMHFLLIRLGTIRSLSKLSRL